MRTWRDAQRGRRTLTLRGRITVAFGLLALAAGAAAFSAWWTPAEPAPPTVASAPPAPDPEPRVEEPAPAPAVPEPAPAPAPAPTPAPRVDTPEQSATGLSPQLTTRVQKILHRGRVKLGHVVAMDPRNGRILAMVSTDPERFPAQRAYPAASLVKVVTTAAAIHHDPDVVGRSCRFRGSPYRLTRARLDPPTRGRETSLRRALAMSNNQCFAQLAVHLLGPEGMLDAIARFGWLDSPAPGFAPGSADAGADAYALGKLGSGLAGSRITPLHAAQTAALLSDGVLRAPVWSRRAESDARRVLTPELASQVREMMVDTTARGTARSAFRDRRGRPLLGTIPVAGKTGSLSGKDPDGRYEWFAGLAPAGEPRLAVAVVLVQGDLWWRSASQIAAEVLRAAFCDMSETRRCDPDAERRWLAPPPMAAAG